MLHPPRPRGLSIAALALVVPAASIGTLCGLHFGPGTVWGIGVYFACKVIILLIPALWFLRFDRKQLAGQPLSKRLRTTRTGVLFGIFSGFFIAGIIVAAGMFLAGFKLLNFDDFRRIAAENHLTSPRIFFLFALGTTFVNALLEEFTWRWFVTRRLEEILPPTPQFPPLGAITAILLSALCFTIHHTIILSLYFSFHVVVLGTLGVFIGATIWSFLYIRHRSIIPGYLSHILADVAIFILAWQWLFPS